MAERDIKYGNNFFNTIENKKAQITYDASYWDLWIAILLTSQFDNNWEALIETIKSDKSSTYNTYNRQERLVNTANENGKRDVALQVFEACLVEGFHYQFLKDKYDKLISEKGDPSV
jgi:hypothetical protein